MNKNTEFPRLTLFSYYFLRTFSETFSINLKSVSFSAFYDALLYRWKHIFSFKSLFKNFKAKFAQNDSKTKNTFYKCVLDLNFVSISAVAVSIFYRKVKITAL
jgi:hypothetical protein